MPRFKVMGILSLNTKHMGERTSLNEVFIIANTREDEDTCLKKDDDQVYESKVLLNGSGHLLQDVRQFEHEEHKSHCLASPPKQWYYVERPPSLLHNTHE